MKSKKIIVASILAIMLTFTAFFTVEIVTPKKAKAITYMEHLIKATVAATICAGYVRNLSGAAYELAWRDCMEWNMR